MIPMRFKTYMWPVNPEEITLRYERNLRELALPGQGSCLQDLGRKRRVLSGKGTFSGPEALRQFRRLAGIFEEETGGLLRVPGFPSFWAVFSELKLTSAGRPGEVSYAFAFVEEKENRKADFPAVYVCRGGESLWDVAAWTGIPLETLREQNRIRWIQELLPGQRICLRKEDTHAV